MSSPERARRRAASGALAAASGPLPWLAGLLTVYLLAPIVAFVVRLGGGAPSEPGLWPALWTSLATATIATALVTILGTPLAYLLARRRGWASRLLLTLLALPLALPPLISGMLLLYVFGPLTFLGRLLGGGLTDSHVGIVLAQSFVAAPFLIVTARAAFAAVDPALEDVAATLGHGGLARFARVAAPAAAPGIGAGIMLTWLRAFGEFGATLILAYHPYGLPVYTYVQFNETGLPATMAPIAVALAAALIAMLAVQLPLPFPRRRRASLPRAETAEDWQGAAAHHAPAGPLTFTLDKRLGGFTLQLAHSASSPRLALLGPSGAGKTVTLRLLAGLLQPGRHDAILSGTTDLQLLPAERRGIGYVPQHSALLPRRTVWSQVNFGRDADPRLAATWLERLGLAGLEDRYPNELSSGQQRRVALARALATRPRLLLLDEPFTGLDAPVRDRLRRDLRRLQRQTGLSTVIVTHDPEEAALLAEEIVVLGDGRALQAGTREEVFRSPRSPEVAALLGIANTRAGVIAAPGLIRAGAVELPAQTGSLQPGSEVIWGIRPERIAVGGADGLAATLLDDVDLGTTRELIVDIGGEIELTVRTTETVPLLVGEEVRLVLPVAEMRVWPRSAAQPDRRMPTAPTRLPTPA